MIFKNSRKINKKKEKVKHAYLSANELEVNLDRTWEIGCAMGIPDTARSA